mmetsp:Transcript_33927/g.72444  ORF Transcript_33927/g.72444 Transcript_33927/m.72444 type:complete len:100 (-) Transcript_33927:804-1103(-)
MRALPHRTSCTFPSGPSQPTDVLHLSPPQLLSRLHSARSCVRLGRGGTGRDSVAAQVAVGFQPGRGWVLWLDRGGLGSLSLTHLAQADVEGQGPDDGGT